MADIKLNKDTYTKEEVEEIIKAVTDQYVHKKYYTMDDIGAILNIKRVQTRALLSLPTFPSMKIGKVYRINIDDFEKWQIDNMNKRIELPKRKRTPNTGEKKS